MKTVLPLALGLALLASQAHAISRYDTPGMSCQRIQDAVTAEGAAILRYPSRNNPSLTLYDRYVAHGGYCQVSEEAVVGYVPASDTASCPVLTCKERVFEPFGDH